MTLILKSVFLQYLYDRHLEGIVLFVGRCDILFPEVGHSKLVYFTMTLKLEKSYAI